MQAGRRRGLQEGPLQKQVHDEHAPSFPIKPGDSCSRCAVAASSTPALFIRMRSNVPQENHLSVTVDAAVLSLPHAAGSSPWPTWRNPCTASTSCDCRRHSPLRFLDDACATPAVARAGSDSRTDSGPLRRRIESDRITRHRGISVRYVSTGASAGSAVSTRTRWRRHPPGSVRIDRGELARADRGRTSSAAERDCTSRFPPVSRSFPRRRSWCRDDGTARGCRADRRGASTDPIRRRPKGMSVRTW
jgi:hypothetical protein